jgi:hypothetical protein
VRARKPSAKLNRTLGGVGAPMTDLSGAPIASQDPADRPITVPLLITVGIATVLQLLTTLGDRATTTGHPGIAYLIGVALGHALVFGLVPFLILLFAVLRHRRANAMLTAFLVLNGWALLLGIVIIAFTSRQAGGADLQAEAQRFQVEVRRQRTQIDARFHALAPSLVIRPASAGSDRRFIMNRTAIAQARQVLADQRAAIARMRQQEHDRLAAISAEAARGFDQGYAGAQARVERLMDLSSQNLDELSATLDFLDRTRDRWTIDGDTWRFQDQADIDEFNRHSERLRQISQEGLALQAELDAGGGGQAPPKP